MEDLLYLTSDIPRTSVITNGLPAAESLLQRESWTPFIPAFIIFLISAAALLIAGKANDANNAGTMHSTRSSSTSSSKSE